MNCAKPCNYKQCPKVPKHGCACCPFRKVVIPTVLGDDSEGSDYAPENGAYQNALVEYEANGALYLYSSDGIYTKLSLAANDFGMATTRYVNQKDAETLVAAKQYTDEHGGGGGGKDNLFYINVTDVDFSEGTFTADKTYAEILEAYNAGKLPIVIVKEEDSSYRYNGIYMLRSYGVNEESDGFDFAYTNATGGEGRVEAGSWVIHIGNNESRANESYGSVEIDNALSQYSNHAVKNSAVYEALSQKVSQADLATVATSGSYNDLTDKPDIPSGLHIFYMLNPSVGNAAPIYHDYGRTDQVTLAQFTDAIASGPVQIYMEYDDHTFRIYYVDQMDAFIPDPPMVIGTLYVSFGLRDQYGLGVRRFLWYEPDTAPIFDGYDPNQSDWNQPNPTDSSYIKNKPNLATVATSGSYNDLSNKPTIPTFTLTTTDPGEGATLAANTFIGVYNG